MEHQGTAGEKGPELSDSLRRQLDDVLGQEEQTLAPSGAPAEGALPEAEAKARDYLSLLQRAQADFQNYKKRVEQERQELREQLRGDIIARLLPVLDDLTRALRELPPEMAGHPWAQGIELVQRKLLGILEVEGVIRVEAQGRPFDPWEHEAVHYEERSDCAEGTVVGVFREGYKLAGRLLRPAQVIVAKAASASQGPSKSTDVEETA